MPKGLDTTVVDLHRVGRTAMDVLAVRGAAWRVRDANDVGTPLTAGDDLRVGETVVVAPEAELLVDSKLPAVGTLTLVGGPRGRAHAFVPEDAFRSSPSREDVPRLVEQLRQLEQQVEVGATEDPLAEQEGPETAFDRAMAREFAAQNLSLEAARLLPEDVARREGAVSLFLHGDAVCVALVRLGVGKIRRIMEAVRRPVNPHLVDAETLDALLARVYAASGEQLD